MSSELMPGENLVLRERQHWIVMVRPLLLPVALLVLALVADFLAIIPSDFRLIATLAVVAILGLALIVVWIRWTSRSFTISDRRVLLDTGIFNRSSKVIPLDRVQDIATSQGLLGRMLGYGRIEIDSAGASGAEVLSALPNPSRFRDAVFSQAENLRTQGVHSERPPTPPV
jgi:membrane protein YdbS with pleckstrin-like domain